MTIARFLPLATLLLSALGGGGCGSDCTEQSCASFGGEASRKFSSCYSSGSGSTDDEFVLRDQNGDEFYKCTRPASDNSGCGVELLIAKEDYCD